MAMSAIPPPPQVMHQVEKIDAPIAVGPRRHVSSPLQYVDPQQQSLCQQALQAKLQSVAAGVARIPPPRREFTPTTITRTTSTQSVTAPPGRVPQTPPGSVPQVGAPQKEVERMDVTLLTVPPQFGEPSLSKNPSAQTISRNNSQFRLALPVAPGATEEAMSQASTARVSTVIGTQAFHHPILAPSLQSAAARVASQPPLRGLGCSPHTQSRSTLLRQKVATGHDIDVVRQEMVTGFDGINDIKKELRDDLKTGLDDIKKELREKHTPQANPKELESVRNKLTDMERGEVEWKSRAKIQQKENDSLKANVQTLKTEKSQLELEVRRKTKSLETALEEEKQMCNVLQKKSDELEKNNKTLAEEKRIWAEEKRHLSGVWAEEKRHLMDRNRELEATSESMGLRYAKLESEHLRVKEQFQKVASDSRLETQQQQAQHATLTKKLRESELQKEELAEILAGAERQNVRNAAKTPAELAGLGNGNVRSALDAHCASLEVENNKLTKMNRVLWSSVPKEAEMGLREKFRAEGFGHSDLF